MPFSNCLKYWLFYLCQIMYLLVVRISCDNLHKMSHTHPSTLQALHKCYLLLRFCCYNVSCYRFLSPHGRAKSWRRLPRIVAEFLFPRIDIVRDKLYSLSADPVSYGFIAPRICHRLRGTGSQISPALLATGIRKWECSPDGTSCDEFYKTHACELFQKAWRTE